MKVYSNVYEVQTICHLQKRLKRLLSLSQFLSYYPLTIFFFFSDRPSGNITSVYL